jgi:hypothetical protein
MGAMRLSPPASLEVVVLLCSLTASSLIACEPARIVLPDAGPGTDAPAIDTSLTVDAPDAPTGPRLTAEVTTLATLETPRLGHTVTLLANGRLIVIGGEGLDRAAIATIEEIDPVAGTAVEVAELPAPRSNHTATLLADGRILVVGGGTSTSSGLPAGTGATGSVVIFDPEDGSVTEGPALARARGHHAAIRLPDDSVLVVGGASGSEDGFDAVASAERWVPGAESWAPAGDLDDARAMLELELDADGDVLAIGGLASAPTTAPVAMVERWSEGSFAPEGSLPGGGRIYHATLHTSDDRVLVIGGLGLGVFLDSTAVLAPDAEAFAEGPELPSARNSVAAVETSRGVLAIGGFDYPGTAVLYDEVFVFDQERGYEAIGALPLGRAGHVAVALPSGDVVVVGGYGALGETDAVLRITVSAE